MFVYLWSKQTLNMEVRRIKLLLSGCKPDVLSLPLYPHGGGERPTPVRFVLFLPQATAIFDDYPRVIVYLEPTILGGLITFPRLEKLSILYLATSFAVLFSLPLNIIEIFTRLPFLKNFFACATRRRKSWSAVLGLSLISFIFSVLKTNLHFLYSFFWLVDDANETRTRTLQCERLTA